MTFNAIKMNQFSSPRVCRFNSLEDVAVTQFDCLQLVVEDQTINAI